MTLIPNRLHFDAEWLRLRRQPLSWVSLGALLAALLWTSVLAGLDAAAWRESARQDEPHRQAALQRAEQQLSQATPGTAAAAIVTYQLGRGDLGSTRMPVAGGLGLGVGPLEVLPARLRASLESRHLDARDAGPIRNPLLSGAGLPGVPSMVALLASLVALVLAGGLLQEERELGRLGLLRVHATDGVTPVLVAALLLRFAALWGLCVLGSLPAFLLDGGAELGAFVRWTGGVGAFCAVWVAAGGLLSLEPMSRSAATLAALSLWILLTFIGPALLVHAAEQASPTPSRLMSILAIRDAQAEAEEQEQQLSADWFKAHPEVEAKTPTVWPASFVPRALAVDRSLTPLVQGFQVARLQQAAFVHRWGLACPGLALVQLGERLAGTDAASHLRYERQVQDFEQRWRAFFVPSVMSRQGISQDDLKRLPRFTAPERPSPSA